jgi:hypothetical protein
MKDLIEEYLRNYYFGQIVGFYKYKYKTIDDKTIITVKSVNICETIILQTINNRYNFLYSMIV